MQIQSPKKTSTSLRSAHLNIVLIFTSEVVFSVSQVLQATLQLASARTNSICLSTWKRPVCEKCRVPRCLEQQ